MINLRALVFQTEAQQDSQALLDQFRSEYSPAGEQSLVAVKFADAVLTPEEWKSVPLIRDADEHLPEAKAREIRIRQRKAQQFWSNLLPDGQRSGDYFTCLGAPFRDWEKGCLVFERTVPGGGVLIFIEHLRLDSENLAVTSVAPLPIAVNAAVSTAGALGVGPEEVGSEVMSVLSLIGMTLIASQPEIGIPLMIGAQIFSFLFAHSGSNQEKKKLPTAETIMHELRSVVADESIKQLLGEANSVWNDIHQKYNKSWEIGYEPSKTDLEDFEGILNRAVGLSTVGSVHDNTNQIHERITEEKEGENHTGLRWLPALTWSGTVEVYGLELRHNLYYAWSNGGVGDDARMNERYANALNNWNQRAGELQGYLATLVDEASAITARRLDAIRPVQTRDATYQIFSNGHSGQTVHGLEYFVEDHGTWPPATQENPVYHQAHYPSIGCCSVTDFDKGAAEADANKARTAYVDKIRNSVLALTGLGDAKTTREAVIKWKKSADLAAKFIEDLKEMKKHHKPGGK
jgi:hypothetical protein